MARRSVKKTPLDRKKNNIVRPEATERLIRPIQQAQMSDETRQAHEENELLLHLGQEDEHKAVAAIKENTKNEMNKAKERRMRAEEEARKARASKTSYRIALLREWENALIRWKDEMAPGYFWKAVPTDRGIELRIKVPVGEVFARGMKISGEADLDIQCIYRLIDKALGFVKEHSGLTRMPDGTLQRKSGIVLPS